MTSQTIFRFPVKTFSSDSGLTTTLRCRCLSAETVFIRASWTTRLVWVLLLFQSALQYFNFEWSIIKWKTVNDGFGSQHICYPFCQRYWISCIITTVLHHLCQHKQSFLSALKVPQVNNWTCSLQRAAAQQPRAFAMPYQVASGHGDR